MKAIVEQYAKGQFRIDRPEVVISEKYFKINTAVSLLAIDMVVTVFNLFVSGTNAFFLAACSSSFSFISS